MTPTQELMRLADEAKRIGRRLSEASYKNGSADERDNWTQQKKYCDLSRDLQQQLDQAIDALVESQLARDFPPGGGLTQCDMHDDESY